MRSRPAPCRSPFIDSSEGRTDTIQLVGVFEHLGGSCGFLLPPERRDGFREAQVAAVHAIVGHFWDQRTPALVVMPTGSGKTAVMLAASIALRAKRVLVVAPSRLLREQLVEKFSTLDPLRTRLGALDVPISPQQHPASLRSSYQAGDQGRMECFAQLTMSSSEPR